jgi:phage FluMu protein Com
MAMTEVRCKLCGKLLLRIEGRARLEIRCPRRRCMQLQTREINSEEDDTARLTLNAA